MEGIIINFMRWNLDDYFTNYSKEKGIRFHNCDEGLHVGIVGVYRVEANYFKGMLNGRRSWNRDGILILTEFLKDGVDDGTHIQYHSNGTKHMELCYKDGKLITWKKWNSDGFLIDENPYRKRV